MIRPHLCHIHPSFGIGGPEVRTSLIINASCYTFQHTIIALNGDLSGQSRISQQSDMRFLEAPRVRGRAVRLRSLTRLLKDLRPDLVLTHGWGGTNALLAAKMGGFPRIIHAEDGFLPDEAHRQRFPRLMARRILLRMPQRVVCPSQTLVRLASKTWMLSAQQVCYIPNGVDIQRFSPPTPRITAAIRHRIGCTDSEVVVGTVGRLGVEKNPERLLRAFAAVANQRPAKLLIVGDGPLREQLGQLAHELGIGDQVLFTGWTDDPLDDYQAMDIFALSSDTEQMPIALLEAMGVGLPVVSTDVGDIRSMVSQENRRLIVPKARDDLYKASLAELINNAEARVQLGRANREKCQEHYRLSTMLQAYVNLYSKTLGSDCRCVPLGLPAEVLGTR